MNKKDLKKLKQLKKTNPELFRMCGSIPCCQSRTLKGELCHRPAMTQSTYIKKVRCCFLCWQHATFYGMYGLLQFFKLAAEKDLTWDEYCFMYPEYCDEKLKPSK